jgi:hypothetical protein
MDTFRCFNCGWVGKMNTYIVLNDVCPDCGCACACPLAVNL